jgi:pyridoxal phosphate enzyme (YggS family)
MQDIIDRLAKIRESIAAAEASAGRQPGQVKLLAVTKGQPASKIFAAILGGQYAFAENYVQEALAKIDLLANHPGVEWHFIGRIQRNKTKAIASHFSWVHSVSSAFIAQRLSDQVRDGNVLNLCLQVNIDQDPNKDGFEISELDEAARAIAVLPGVRLRGLMTIPKAGRSEQQRIDIYHNLRDQLQLLNQGYQLDMDTLSMGMSDDYALAIGCGATMIRIGRALFGERDTI